MKIEKLCRKK